MRRIHQLTLFLLILAFLPLQAEEAPDLVIAHTNDLHAHYRPFESRSGEIRGGIARIAGRIAELRAEYGDRFLYLDAGDLFQGTPFYHFHRGSLGVELLSAMHCDLMCLGNHELDDGSANFFRAMKKSSFPVVCANLNRADGSALLPAAMRLEAGGFSIDAVGLLTGSLDEICGEAARGELLVLPPEKALASWLQDRKSQADLTLALSHCGLNEDRTIADAVPEVPLIIGGHSHSFLYEPELRGPVTICQTGCYGYNLGVLKAWQNGDGSWRFEETLEEVREDWPLDENVQAIVERASHLVDREMNVVLGRLRGDFGIPGKSSQPDPLGQMVASIMQQAAGADIGLQNVGGYRTFLKEGDLRREDLFTLLPFDNHIMRLRFRGDQIQTLFNFIASGLNSHRFGQTSGIEYRIHEGQARDIRIDGQKLDPAKDYLLATLDFLYGGGDGFTLLQEALEAETLDIFSRDEFEKRLLEGFSPAPEDYAPNFIIE
ncbi:MAG: bifunctional UDP-sugar hydrolase/5'-nucleotidase [Candidatus Krumholzibacteria bacterium]|jgi:2',3'-cyclic-nucleotide 2'-phosphodiesterase (5'-nucleotidase family)|nr:bifunctional UDP-sugar hydrolase/5'-nucleotidase [Candidatus Krumholzibacteria bacterium]MDP6797034.1 bifunctional UDP-sugar hydrolase/5'-nucleotidase [Candidatus Krumholzibacteria bacterium]MDP7021016.1 bifunctional UDP-sugar hydrolase/5'-nucleotidase [Candidatus Krumholzibacteria bacterium]